MDSSSQIPHSSPTTSIFVIMGVTGSGKTTIGQLLAEKTGIVFADADDYHPEANKEKMAAGHPLDDADRQPWLVTLNGLLLHWHTSHQGGVLACSALKASYRTTLATGMPENAIRFILLEVPKEILEARLKARHHQFMNPDLLDSQIATLETPPDDDAIKVSNNRDPDAVVVEILAKTAQQSATDSEKHEAPAHGTSAL